MEISRIDKNKSVQLQQVRDTLADPAKKVGTEENSRYTAKNRVDSAEISGSYSGSFADKRITVAKSAILHDVAADAPKERLQALKDAIEDGSYQVSAEDLAEEMLK